MMNTELKNVKTIALKQELFGLDKGTQFERVNDLFVCNIVDSIEGDGYSYTRKETRSYNSAVIEEYKDLFEVVEYTEEYKQLVKESLEKMTKESRTIEPNKPFKPRKEVRKLISKYEQMIADLEQIDKTQEDQAAITVYWNLIKVLKWVINESDEQIC